MGRTHSLSKFLSHSLSDTEILKDISKDLVGGDFAGDLTQVVQYFTNILCKQGLHRSHAQLGIISGFGQQQHHRGLLNFLVGAADPQVFDGVGGLPDTGRINEAALANTTNSL